MTVLQGRAIQGEAPESDSSSSEIDEAEDGQRGKMKLCIFKDFLLQFNIVCLILQVAALEM